MFSGWHHKVTFEGEEGVLATPLGSSYSPWLPKSLKTGMLSFFI